MLLSLEYAAAHGNAAASAGWFARAEGLLRDEDPCLEQGWLALTPAERASDPDTIGAYAQEALDLAHGSGGAELDTEALAKLGYAQVAAGDVVEGVAKLDEATAAATGGEVGALEVIGV